MDKFRAQYALHKKYRHKNTKTSKVNKQVVSSGGSKENEFYSASSLITESTTSNSVDSRERNRQEPHQVVENEAFQPHSEAAQHGDDEINNARAHIPSYMVAAGCCFPLSGLPHRRNNAYMCTSLVIRQAKQREEP